jgi:hypothetical protein
MTPLRRYIPPPLGIYGQRILLALLVELCLLNVADFALTRYAMWLGFATESNGIMSFFFKQSAIAAAAVKLSILLAGVFAAVVAYEILWIASL